MKKVILTGAIGSGKSTVLRAAMQRLGWATPAGYFTHWDGQPRGAQTLYAESWRGERIPMAHRRAPCGGPDAMPPYVLTPDFIPFAATHLTVSEPGQPVVVDELGLIELETAPIITAVSAHFRAANPVWVVIQQRALGKWRLHVPELSAATIFAVTPKNRADLPASIVGA